MIEEVDFQDLIRRIRAGDEAAAAALVRTYEPAIRREARVRLSDSRLRRLFDSMDICQSVLASFFVRAALGQYELEQPEQLLRLLVDMSRKKLVDRARAGGRATGLPPHPGRRTRCGRGRRRRPHTEPGGDCGRVVAGVPQ